MTRPNRHITSFKPKTLSKHQLKTEPQLNESQILQRAAKLFRGDRASAEAWFAAPCRALNGLTPREVAANIKGAKRVEQLLGRLENGVFS